MKVVIFDTETDGLIANSAIPIHKQPRIVELFALVLEQKGEGASAKFKTVSEYERLFDTERPIPPDTIRITGITQETIREARALPFREHRLEVAQLFEGADRIVAHNLSFDKSMVDNELERAGLGRLLKWPERVCTVEATEHYFGFRLNLTLLYKTLFDEVFKDAHRARTDVEALARCYCELVKRGDI